MKNKKNRLFSEETRVNNAKTLINETLKFVENELYFCETENCAPVLPYITLSELINAAIDADPCYFDRCSILAQRLDNLYDTGIFNYV